MVETWYNPGDPIPRKHFSRMVGETNRDALDRLTGMLLAEETDRRRLAEQRADVLAYLDACDSGTSTLQASVVRRMLGVTDYGHGPRTMCPHCHVLIPCSVNGTPYPHACPAKEYRDR